MNAAPEEWAPPTRWPSARRLRATVWHHGPPGRTGVAVADQSTTEGRYHRRGAPGAWYGSSTEQAMWREFDRHFDADEVERAHILRRAGTYAVDVDVLDLTDDTVLAGLGLARHDLVGDDYGLTQAVADAARGAGFTALLVPSAADSDATTLVVFDAAVDCVAEKAVAVTTPPPRQ